MAITARARFERALRDLQDEVLALGGLVDRAIGRSIEALQLLDPALAREIIRDDDAIDDQARAIENQAIDLIARQQPMAGDLRTIIAAVHIVSELERIGDYAEGNAKIVLLHGDQPHLKPLVDIPRMATIAQEMLRRSLIAFVERDAEAAKRVAAEDDEVDRLYDQVYRELLTYMLNDPRTIDRATWLIWVSHNLERTADRVTNICERVVYEVTGTLEGMNGSTY